MTAQQAYAAAEQSQAAANQAAILLCVIIAAAVIGVALLARYLHWQTSRRDAATARHQARRTAAGFSGWDFDREVA